MSDVRPIAGGRLTARLDARTPAQLKLSGGIWSDVLDALAIAAITSLFGAPLGLLAWIIVCLTTGS